MKKSMKRVLSLVLAVSLILAMSVTAFAANGSDISVKLNGSYLSFTDAEPTNIDGRIFVPFRAVFESLGAKVDYDFSGATKTVTAVRGTTTATMTIGSKNVTVVKDGVTSTIQMDVAPVIQEDSGRTLIPIRFAAEVLGCNVGWDSTNKVVLIDDVDAILAANTETYSIINKYLAYSAAYNKTATNGDFTMDMSITDAGETLPIKATGTFSGVSGDKAVEMTMNMKMNLDEIMAGQELTADDQAMLDLLNDLTMDIIVNMETGKVYIKSDALVAAMGLPATNVWFSTAYSSDDLGDLSMNTIMDLNNVTDFEDLLSFVVANTDLTDKDFTGTEAIAVLNALFGDSAFSKTADGYVSKYSYTESGTAVSMNFVINTSGDVVTGYGITLNLSDSDTKMDISASMNGDACVIGIVLDMDGIAIDMKMNAAYSESTKQPASAPPTGSSIIDLDTLS